MKNFFGFGTGQYPYGAPADGYLSWQHLVFVSSFVLIAIGLAIFLGIRNKNKSEKIKNKVLIWTAIIIDAFEIAKIIKLNNIFHRQNVDLMRLSFFDLILKASSKNFFSKYSLSISFPLQARYWLTVPRITIFSVSLER